MSIADIVIIVVCLLSAVFGFWRGLAKEALSLLTWVAAVVLAWRFGAHAAPWFDNWIAAPELRVWAARALIFVIVIFAGGLVAWAVREFMQHSGLSGTDRMLGGLFGFARGVFIVGLCAIALHLTQLDRDPWWQQSMLRPYVERVAAGITRYGSLGRDYIKDNVGDLASSNGPAV